MSYTLNNVTAPDSPNTTSTLQNLPDVTSINIDVANQAIYWQVQQIASPTGLYTEATWQEATYMLPGSRSIYRSAIRGFRFWAATPAAQLPSGSNQAQVTTEAVT